MDFSTGDVERVIDAAKPHRVILQNQVTGARIAVPWLTDAPAIHHRLAVRELESLLLLRARFWHRWRDEVGSGCEDSRNVGVPLETVFPEQLEDVLHLERVVDVFWKNVFVQRSSGGAMHKQQVSLGMHTREFTEEVAELVGGIPRHSIVLFELGTSPANRLLSTDVESVWIEEGPLIVVAQQHQAAPVADEFHALAGIGAVANHVTQTGDGVDLLLVDILEYGTESLEIAVDVADDGPLHEITTTPPSPVARSLTLKDRFLIQLSLRMAPSTVKRRSPSGTVALLAGP